MTPASKIELSDVAAQVVARGRRCVERDVASLIGVVNGVSNVAIRVPTGRETMTAWAGAHALVDRLKSTSETAAKNPEILNDALGAYIVATAFRDATKPLVMPAWPSGDWVLENMTSDQIGALLNLANSIRAEESPTPDVIDDGRVEAFIELCARTAGTDAPDVALAALSHDYLSQVFILTAVKLLHAREELAESRTEGTDVQGDG